MDSFNAWLTSWAQTPALWIMAGFAALFGVTLLILQSVKPTPRRKVIDAIWLSKNYPFVVFGVVATLLAAATTFYLFEMGLIVGRAVNILGDDIADGAIEPAAFRNYAYGIAAFVGVLAASATLFFQPIRLWLNERNARNAEQGLLTDRIREATQQLGNESIPVRMGGILALRRLLDDAPQEKDLILRTINAYVTHEAVDQDLKSDGETLRVDLQAALEIMTGER